MKTQVHSFTHKIPLLGPIHIPRHSSSVQESLKNTVSENVYKFVDIFSSRSNSKLRMEIRFAHG